MSQIEPCKKPFTLERYRKPCPCLYIVLLVVFTVPFFGQTNTTLNLSTQGRNADFSKFPFTRPLTQGPSLPSTCQVGQLFFNTAAPFGTNISSCVSPNTWAGVGSGYTYTLPPATATTLGGVIIGSGLAVVSGSLSPNFGTVAGTVAAGNDSRITSAVQASNNLSDIANKTTALQNLKLTGMNPATIASDTTGNAASARTLQGTGPLRIVGGVDPAMLVQSCGTSPTIAGSDSAGIVVVGSGTVTGCTIPFVTAFVNPPTCTANDNSAFLVLKASASTTALTLSAQSSFGGNTLSYICIGK
jgi:hypothetical protein